MGGLFSWVLLSSDFLTRQLAVGGWDVPLSTPASCSGHMWAPVALLLKAYRGGVCKPSTGRSGRWGVPCCLLLTCLPNLSQCGPLPWVPSHYDLHPREPQSRRAHGANWAKRLNVLPGNPRILACQNPQDNRVGPGSQTVPLSTITSCKTHIHRGAGIHTHC